MNGAWRWWCSRRSTRRCGCALRIEQASLTDPLTNLHNRRFLEQVIQADLDMVKRRHLDGLAHDSDLVSMMLDLKHFKQVNDQLLDR